MTSKQQHQPKNKSYAARFRAVFEAAEQELLNPPRPVNQPRKLARGPEKQPVIKEVDGTNRYVYEDGTIDKGSIASPEVEERAYKIGGIATKIELIEEPETEVEALTPQEGKIAVAASPIATGNNIA